MQHSTNSRYACRLLHRTWAWLIMLNITLTERRCGCTTVSVYWSVLIVLVYNIILGCVVPGKMSGGITFQIKWLFMDQVVKSLRQSKIPDFFAVNSCEIMNFRFLKSNCIWRLLIWSTIANTLINSFCFCERLLLGHKCVQFKQFFTDISGIRWHQVRNNHLRIIWIFA